MRDGSLTREKKGSGGRNVRAGGSLLAKEGLNLRSPAQGALAGITV